MKENFNNMEFQIKNTAELTLSDVTSIKELFDRNYQQANQEYLDHSLKALRRISLALEEGCLVGFSLADSATIAIPRMKEKQLVMLGGVACIDTSYRRKGLFSHLATLSGGERKSVLSGAERVLACARVAHPASFRTLCRLPGAIPKHDQPLSEWHLEVGAVIANLYGVTLKPQSLIVQGNGTPIGYPNIDVKVSEEEWLAFAEVNREQGDSLLGVAWAPSAPDGW